MANLFSFGDVKNHPSRSGFDLSKKNAFTAKVGELLPVYWRLVYPGDKFNLNVQHFTRTQPVNTAAFTRIREYFDFYFVPMRLLNKNMGQALVQMQNNPVQASDLLSSKIVTTDIPYVPVFKSGESSSQAGSEDFECLSYVMKYAYNNFAASGHSMHNQFDFALSATSSKLLSYLGYKRFLLSSPTPNEELPNPSSLGLSSNPDYSLQSNFGVNVNILPLLAYQKIYADFFRFSQWEKNEPFTYNVDYYSGGSIFSSLTSDSDVEDFWNTHNFLTLRYCNWNKDMFMGGLPEQQIGDVATVDISSPVYTGVDEGSSEYAPVYSIGKDGVPSLTYSTRKVVLSDDNTTTPVGSIGYVNGNVIHPEGSPAQLVLRNSELLSSVNSFVGNGGSFDVIRLRLAEATQKWREISQCADQTYRDQIKAHFGVSLSPALSDKCIYIGGSASTIDINEVVNTNLYAENASPDPYIKGKGIGTSQFNESFSADEYGIIMCIYHALPLLDYDLSGFKQELLYVNTEDLPIPEFDSIGMQSLPLVVFWNNWSMLGSWRPTNPSVFMSYVPRYIELKTDVDEIQGAFSTTLKNWVAAYDESFFSQWASRITDVPETLESIINYNFFKVNPHIVDTIFNVKSTSDWDSDQLLVNSMFNITAVRNFDYNGLPY